MNGQAGKGPELRKGANLPNFREGYDSINWGAAHNKRKSQQALKRSRAERAMAKERLAERHAESLRQALEIRDRLTKTYFQSGNGQEEQEESNDTIIDI
jgi:hypothetical protein